MALNPPLTNVGTGEPFPTPFTGEYFALQRTGVDLEVKDLPFVLQSRATTWKGRGTVILSSFRAVFVADDQRGELKAFDLPLAYVRRHRFNQPILGCNNITGQVWPVLDEGGPSGSLPPIQFKLSFTRGGVGTFVPLYHSFHRTAQSDTTASHGRRSSVQNRTPSELVATALVDPNDPTTLYLAQPAPSAPPMDPPVYAKDYNKDEVYESMEPRATRTPETSDRPQVEDEAWLEVSLSDGDVHFGRAEVNEAVEEIVGLLSDDDEGSGGAEADVVIDSTNSQVRSSSYIERIMHASQRMVNHPGVQSAALTAIQDDPELRNMIAELSNSRIELVDDWTGPITEYDARTARRRHRRQANPLATMLEDVGYFFSNLLRGLKDIATAIGRALYAALSWLWNSVKKAAKIVSNMGGALDDMAAGMLPLGARFFYSLGTIGRAAPFVLAGAMLVMVVMIIKRTIT